MKITFKSGPVDTIEGDEAELVRAMKAMSADPAKISEHDRVVLHNSVLTQMVETLESRLRITDAQLNRARTKLFDLGFSLCTVRGEQKWLRQPGWADRGFASGGMVPPRPSFRQPIDYQALDKQRVRMTERMNLALKEHAAAETLERMNFSYTEGAQLWKPPLGKSPFEEGKVYDSSAWTGRRS